ncbi:MAG TPA: FadR/GntR family transcriptional regulator [Chloroflexota bacterium]|nr:FadR/GntR family transcriptional regulator [Chloroflexota bacterium]
MTQSPVLSPISKTRAYEQAAEQISARIRDGVWQPGDRLPSERDLALQLGISRGSTREALRVLEAMGWLEIRPGDGTIVRDRAAKAAAGGAGADLLAGLSVEVGDLWEVRKLIEPGAAALAAERCSPDELATIEGVLARMQEMAESTGQDAPTAVFRANPDFHMAVAWASGNAMIAHIQKMLVGAEVQALQSVTHEDRTPEQARSTLAEHRRIYEAIRAGKPREAERAAFDHLVTSWMATWRGTRSA